MNDDLKKFLKDKILNRIFVWLCSVASGISWLLAFLFRQIFPNLSLSELDQILLIRTLLFLLASILGLIAYIIYLKTKDKLIFFNDLYWLPKDPIPFCPRCKDIDGKLIHMIFNPRSSGHNAHYLCSNPKCELWRAPSEHPKKKGNKKQKNS